jgi:manganese efflux pump family protein
MNFAATAALSLAMATDAFAVAIGKGASLKRPSLRAALRIGLIFGIVEGLTPLAGYALGRAAAPYVEAWDHWIAFGLLSLLGLRMIRESLSGEEEEDDRPDNASFWLLVLTGFATSIDALIVGVGLAFLDVNIYATAAAIGFCTFTLVTLGIMLGRALGAVVGHRAELVGGLVLIGIGSAILYEHLTNPALAGVAGL